MSHAPMPGAESLVEPLRSRWSPSIFDAEHRLPTAAIVTLLHAAQWAPSSGNLQPWRFVVCERGSTPHQALVPHLSRGNSGWVPRASVVFLSATQVEDAPDKAADDKPVDVPINIYCVGQAAAHLSLQAHSMGLWVHQFRAFDKDPVAAALGVPPWWRILAGIAVGVRGNPAGVPERDREREHRVRARKPLAEIAYGDAWEVPWEGALNQP
ncbi:nitroreductase family protein [Nocardioides bizhenqiangii]|uniref:Nitroreductase family protein n=1 Tax=Nocardioides bizhenqiangii TaxID=3095076 RepID=A0ABZ0ZQP9_9ACTN|nr:MULTISPECIES: nitroreductase family protein [unclassified Nocardioides]MDZ5619298.1 nitroreductase family protein [Nocardioides sp. HM23]WQQ26679.1 nitroreductase family protein [Nocardioides sp. HM61]